MLAAAPATLRPPRGSLKSACLDDFHGDAMSPKRSRCARAQARRVQIAWRGLGPPILGWPRPEANAWAFGSARRAQPRKYAHGL